jgi:hypothetical protein
MWAGRVIDINNHLLMLKRKIILKFCISMLMSVILASCGPTIHYLGDSHSPTSQIDLYYDAREVKKEYKIIGRMTNDKFVDYHPDAVKKEMIKKARQVGSDGIIFSDLSVEHSRSQGDKLTIKAELIKYQ